MTTDHPQSTRLTPLELQPCRRGSDLPLRLWLLPVGTAVSACVVAAATATGDEWFVAAWLVVATAVLAAALTFAFSEARWYQRLLFALVAGGFAPLMTAAPVLVVAVLAVGR